MQKQPVFGHFDSACNFLGDWAARVYRVAKDGCLDVVRMEAMNAKNI